MNRPIASARSARRRSRRVRIRRIRAVGLLVVVAAIAASLAYHSLASSSSRAASPTGVPRAEHRSAVVGGVAALPPREQRRALGEADGAVPRGTSVFDDVVPGVANLDPDLLDAVRQAAAAAVIDGVAFVVDSGWRSSEYQEHLFDEAVSEYGSATEAARWVATPKTSAHVSGDAIDIGPSDAAPWLSERGAEYGLCQIYRNEPWHYELRPEAGGHGCPAMYADPTRDPRMQR